MIDLIIFLALGGSVVAGLWDLKTTEVPDQLPYAMIGVGIIYWIFNWQTTGNFQPLMISIVSGTALLAVGLIMYRFGQWGGADAWILAAIAYMIPVYNGELFLIPYLMNFMFVTIAYVAIYAIIVGIKNRKEVLGFMSKDITSKRTSIFVFGLPLALSIFILAVTIYNPRFSGLYFLGPAVFFMMIFWRYAKAVENKVFKRKIKTSELRAGDVLQKGKWIGLTAKELIKLRRQKKFVEIKDGVRFVPVFAITIAVTIVFGNLFLFLLF
jgi:Flp pilus assembly protein protease CpaA